MKKNYFNIMLLAILIASAGLFVTSCKDDDDVAVESVALNKTSTTVSVGGTETLSVVFTPSNASNQDVTWKSANTGIATVDKGVVTGVTVGQTKVIAISEADSTLSDTCVVTVSAVSSITVSGDITASTTWAAQNIYKLSGFVYVKDGVTLTIEAGTIIKGVSGTKGTLIIERGATIMAQGTAEKPIVFTSDKDPGSRATGDWGGVVICGKALTNKSDGGSAGVGVAEGGINSLYGGSDDTDNSGVFQYVRIEFAGIPLAATSNSEINGLSLCAVGSGTTIDHVQVSYSGDDSYEWFGGTVNCKYLVAWRGIDDDFDTDNGYRGNLQFLLGARDPELSDQSGSNGFESDNDGAGSLTEPFTQPIFSNVTILGPMAATSTLPATHQFKRAMHIRRSSRLSVYNSVFIGYPKGLIIDGGTGDSPTQAENDVLQIENCILAGMTTNYEAASGTVNVAYTTAQIEAYFTNADRNNSVASDFSGIYTGYLSLTSPGLLPTTGSSVLSGASFSNTRLSGSSFFTQVTYQGAFGTEDWTAGWCNFDPQNTVY